MPHHLALAMHNLGGTASPLLLSQQLLVTEVTNSLGHEARAAASTASQRQSAQAVLPQAHS